MSEGTKRPGSYLLYDGECPVCRTYVAWTALRQSHPDIVLLDARMHMDLVQELRADGIEINDTFLLQLDGQRDIGAAAMARISALMDEDLSASRWLRRLTRSESLLRPVYPILVRARKALLWITGRQQIR